MRHTLSHVLRLVVPLTLLLAFLVAPAAAQDPGEDEASGPGEVVGVVSNTSGKTLRDVDVRLVQKSTGEEVGRSETDKRGEFEIEIDDVDGPYQIHFAAEGYAPFDSEVRLMPGERMDLEITLLDEATGRRNAAIAAYNEGAELHGEGEMEAAEEKFRRAVELDPGVAQGWLGLADVLVVTGRAEEAVTTIERFLELEPENAQGQRLAYEIYRRAGEMEKAEELAEALGIEASSRDLAVELYNEGAVASQEGDNETALARFREAVEMDPSLGPAHAGIASILYNQGEMEAAAPAARKAVELQPDHAQSQRILYLVLASLGKPEASEAWQAYRELDEAGAVDLLYLTADRDFRDDQTEAARKNLEVVLSIDPDHARSHFLLGKIYAGSDPAQAKEHLQRFLELAPDDPEAPTAEAMLEYM